jgi:hypothetical protein
MHAQEEILPPRGKGRAVVVVSGHDGALRRSRSSGMTLSCSTPTKSPMVNGSSNTGGDAARLRTAIRQAQQKAACAPRQGRFGRLFARRHDKLEAITELDLEQLLAIDPPRGYGRG